jgi:hypothetical protein
MYASVYVPLAWCLWVHGCCATAKLLFVSGCRAASAAALHGRRERKLAPSMRGAGTRGAARFNLPPGMKCESHLTCMQLNMTLERLDRVQSEFMPANSSLAHTVSREVAVDSEWPLPQRSSDSWLLRRSADGTAASNANGAEVRVAGNPSTNRDWEPEAHASAAAGGREAAAKRDRPQTRAALPARTLEVV